MNRSLTILACAGLLAACQAAPRTAPVPAPAGERKVSVPRASATPAGVTTTAAAPASKLLRPADGTRLLSGVVRVDASYMAGTGAGRLLGADGATLVGADGGTLVGADGASLIGADGATAIAAAGASFLPAGGGNAIAPLRPGAGGGLIGADGATVVSAGGGGLVGADGASYHLTQAAGPLKVGQALPAAGMTVVALSLADNKPLPIGRDAAGEPVYGVLTDAAGAYAIYPPAEAQGNMRLVVFPAGSRDDRLRYGVFADPSKADKRDVSEAAALASRYVHVCILSQLDGFLDRKNRTQIEVMLAAQSAAAGADLPAAAGIKRLEAAADTVGYATMPAAERQVLLARVADAALADIDLGAIRTQDGESFAMAVIETRLERGNQQVADLMARPPEGKTAATMFDGVPELEEKGYRILRPADYNEFIVTRFIAVDPLDSGTYLDKIAGLRLHMGLPVNAGVGDLGDAGYSLALGIGFKLFGVEGEANGRFKQPIIDAIEAALADYKEKHP